MLVVDQEEVRLECVVVVVLHTVWMRQIRSESRRPDIMGLQLQLGEPWREELLDDSHLVVDRLYLGASHLLGSGGRGEVTDRLAKHGC